MTRTFDTISCIRRLGLAAGIVVSVVAFENALAADGYPVEAKVIQVMAAFDNPEGAIFSADGKSVFISNSAEIGDRGKDFAWTEGEGYISKLSVGDDGQLAMVEEKLIDGLTGPLGMAVLPVATGKFPAGTIILCVGSAPLVDSNGEVVKDPARLRTKLVAFNDDGEVLGEIDTGTGSIFHKIGGNPVALINALGFDADGNLFFADTEFGAGQFDGGFSGGSGAWMIPHGSLDALADGQDPEAPPVFLSIPGNPDGVEVSPLDGKVYINTVGPVADAPDPAEGGVYALTIDDFKSGNLPTPIDTKLGALDGLDFTNGGLMLNTQIKGDVEASIYVNCPGQAAKVLSIAGDNGALAGPADLAVRRASDGSQLVIVPELMARDATPGDDEVTVLMLPAGFDKGC
ncbi:MAG: hypothetical protein AAF557_12990 [Pseudomonadota bacterium]